MTWRDQLRPASFRGVPFHVEDDDLGAGRRVQIHEYPQRDWPYAEDLGRATRKITVVGYLIGPEYMAARDRLLAAVEEAGPGELVHPQFGSLQVVVEEFRTTHSSREGGMARLSITFVEAGELAFPSAAAHTPSVVEQRADALRFASLDDFVGAFHVAGLPDFVADGALTDLVRILELIEGLFAVRPNGSLAALVARPRALADSVMSLFASSSPAGGVGTPARLAALARAAGYRAPAPTYPTVTPSRQQQTANGEALAALVRRAALIQTGRTVAASDWPVHDDAIRVRDQVSGLIDTEVMQPTVSDPAFRALTGLRVAVVKDIMTRAAGAARLRTVMPSTVQPAVALAYDLYEDAGREEEIILRNRVVHPGFVPVAPLKVLA
jgi:prophage DNA circulation protein